MVKWDEKWKSKRRRDVVSGGRPREPPNVLRDGGGGAASGQPPRRTHILNRRVSLATTLPPQIPRLRRRILRLPHAPPRISQFTNHRWVVDFIAHKLIKLHCWISLLTNSVLNFIADRCLFSLLDASFSESLYGLRRRPANVTVDTSDNAAATTATASGLHRRQKVLSVVFLVFSNPNPNPNWSLCSINIQFSVLRNVGFVFVFVFVCFFRLCCHIWNLSCIQSTIGKGKLGFRLLFGEMIMKEE